MHDETDDAEIVKALQHDLGDLDIFRPPIARWLRSRLPERIDVEERMLGIAAGQRGALGEVLGGL